MTDNLEDILGGVEDEIRLAEERLQQDVFRVNRAGAASGNQSPLAGSTFDYESDGERLSEEIRPVFPRRGLATRRRTPSLRLSSDGGPSMGEILSTDKTSPRSNTMRGGSRRRAWVDLENDDFPSSIASGVSVTRSERGSRAHDREAMVNRLLQEREARLAARSPGAAERRMPGNGGTAEGSGTGAVTHPETATLSSSRAIPGGNGHSSARVEEGSGGDDGDGSPSAARENIFFASDLAYPDDISQGGGPNVHAGADGARAAAGEEPVEALLRRLHDEETHADTDIKDNELSCISVASAARRVEESDRHPTGSANGRFVDEDDAMATARLEDRLAFRPKERENKNRSSLQQRKPRAGSERRIKELARDRQALYSDRERRRKELQEEAETKECTFHPNIVSSSAARRGAAGHGSGGAGARRPPLHERLHKEAREREAARALAHHHLENEALRECTFQARGAWWGGDGGREPTLNTTGAVPAADHRPLHQRVWEVEREREHKLRLLVADKEEREGATFAPPPMGRVSERLADTRPAFAGGGGGGACGEGVGRSATRLQEQAMWARERRRLRVQEHEEAEARMSTFEPSISRGTKSLVRKRPDLQAPFEQRRAIMDAKRKERERLRQEARAKEETGWFNPTTAQRTDALLRRRMPERLEETVEERVKRMAAADDHRRRNFVMTQKAKEKLECTFRPSLNPVTHSMAQASPLDELVNNLRGQRVRERVKAKVSDAQACSHKPTLLAEAALLHTDAEGAGASRDGGGCAGSGGRGAAAAGLYGPGNRYRLSVREPARMTAELRAREREQEERFNALRQEKEVAEMQRCTFVPQTNSAILRAEGPVLVRGLGRHLELKDVAQQRERERREREARAFGVRPRAVRRSVLGETIVEPFSLSSDNKGWWQERRMRHEAERAAQCTFKPWTVEAERGRALSRLLDWSSVLSSQSSRGS
ncbi:hypothetical protein Esi_0133_0021 [Ectocarpus siliculosus]|uniref:Uncharacterized protein n=1 Tax=Ectocarpus siliculosus TaxID=2880 RepID=D7FJD2_ECTSI|nr:hypothetical protein Esi_0133_0021 [Ectocarpus siliculosus]|eukprot:CBJ29035.1 hypothetical protein Esi_0133_0021 [Ectocarpus siliculosus]